MLLIKMIFATLAVALFFGPYAGVLFFIACMVIGLGVWVFSAAEPRGPEPIKRYIPLKNGKYPVSGALDIEYVDSSGERTERYIEARSVEVKDRRLYLWGWCEQRNAIRQFRVDRIATLSDGQTGEIVEQAKIHDWLIERALSPREAVAAE